MSILNIIEPCDSFLYFIASKALNYGKSLVKNKDNKISTRILHKALHTMFFNTHEIIQECSESSLRELTVQYS